MSRAQGSRRFGPGRISLAPVLFLTFGALPLALSDPRLRVVLLVPLACAVWVVRARVVVSPAGLEACDGLRVRRLAWSEVQGLDVPPRGRVRVLTADGPLVLVALPREQVPRFLEAVRAASSAAAGA